MKTTIDLETCSANLYRSSQAADFATATRDGSAYQIEETYGYTSTVDSLLNMERVASMMDHQSASADIRIRMRINGRHDLPECFLSEAQQAIDDWLKE